MTIPATITPADRIPGLYDIRTADGREWRDLTTNQVTQIIRDERLVPEHPQRQEGGPDAGR